MHQRGLLLLAMVLLSIFLTQPPTIAAPSKSQPAKNGKIAFQSSRKVSGFYKDRIYAVPDASNSEAALLSNATGDTDWNPVWSPDGTKIAFLTERPNSSEVYVMDANDPKKQTNVTNDKTLAAQLPAWSPDGKKIVFTGNTGKGQLYLTNADGKSKPTKLTDNVDANVKPTWSPDGTKIAFTSKRDGGHHIHTIGADGTNETDLTKDWGEDDYDPDWSPDGKKIAFDSNRTGNYLLYVMNVAGSSEPTKLSTAAGSGDRQPLWSPDGKKIAFDSLRSQDGKTTRQVYVMEIASSKETNVSNDPTRAEKEPVWSPDGKKIALESGETNNSGDIYTVGADGTNKTPLTNTGLSEYPSWQPVS